MLAKWIASVSVAVLAASAALVMAQEAPLQVAAAVPEFKADEGAAQGTEFRTLDEETQDLKKQVLDLNRDLFLLEEEERLREVCPSFYERHA